MVTLRTAAGLSPEEAGQLADLSAQTIRNWEAESGAGTYFKILLYIRALAQRADMAQDLVLSFFGLRPALQRDPRIEEKIEVVRAAYASNDPLVHSVLSTLELMMNERLEQA